MKIVLGVILFLVVFGTFVYARGEDERHTHQLDYKHKLKYQHRVHPLPQAVNPPLAFIVHGDTHAGYTEEATQVHTQIVDEILGYKPNRVFNLGDVVHGQWGGPANWNLFDDVAGEVVRNYPYYPTIGNHDQRIGVDHYLAYFSTYTNASINGTYYYVETDEAIHVVLNVNALSEQGDYDDQLIWLDNVLSQFENKTYKFAYFHRPVYTSGERGACIWARGFTDIFETYDVDIVFMGHVHAYERFYIDGIHYIVSGGSGGVPHTLDSYIGYPIGTREYHDVLYHYLTVFGDNGSIEIQAHDLEGNVFDNFTIIPGVDYVPNPEDYEDPPFDDGGILPPKSSFLNLFLVPKSLAGAAFAPLFKRYD